MAKRKQKTKSKIIGTMDFETDPFKYDRVPQPFAGCVYFSDENFQVFWGDASPYLLAEYLRELPKCTIYAHNGGKFDFFFLLEYAEHGTIAIRNGRIAKMKIGRVTLCDSWPLMPFPLAAYQKTEINYDIFERNLRNKTHNRQKIISYLVDDCRDLLQLVTGFRAIVGPKDTIGGAAFFQMKQLGYKIESGTEEHDEKFRPYYYGGRVQAFKKGIFKGKYLYLDINSAYPFAMTHQHPIGTRYYMSKDLPADYGPCFVHFRGISRGALPVRDDGEDGLNFPDDNIEREFKVTGWEVRAGLDTGTIKINEIIAVYIPQKLINFDLYVKTFFAHRAEAKKKKDKIGDLAFKYLLNSGYGKFAQNPREFKNYRLGKYGDDMPGWDYETDFGAVTLWSQSSYRGEGFYDVATGASITGFVRAMLWRAVCASQSVLYCDTDSLICKSSTVEMGELLGQWKIEGKTKKVMIGGKKLYGVQWDTGDLQNGEKRLKFKLATKGVKLTLDEVEQICKGITVEYKQDAPSFSVKHGARFIKRDICQT